MPRLRPYPFPALVRRMFRELDQRQSIFDLPQRAFFRGAAGLDLSVRVHGHLASTPFGPAAGPHTQLAQNIVLSWLAGGRVIELKTVQVNDDLTIPRPCIDMRTVGFNVEWSQELPLEESLEEYVKAAMLVRMLVASGRIPALAEVADTVFDMSVGYDLHGITSEKVQAFLRGMLDTSATVARLRAQVPAEYKAFADVDVPRRLSGTLTLSTFHGCPPGEIENIVDVLQARFGLHVTVKLNPTLLGAAHTLRLLHDVLGYRDLAVPAGAFETDLSWEHAAALVERLGPRADARGLGFGVKFTNTLVVENREGFLPAGQKEMYLSGPPLHVLAMSLVRRFRRVFGDRYPVSFSGGIDRVNFPDAVALGLVPVTVCSDMLKPGGYGRARAYFQNLADAMRTAEAATIPEFVTRAFGEPPRELRAAVLRNTELYVAHALTDARYTRAHNARGPRSVPRALALFDCLACDKCVPVCPNDANFTFVLPTEPIPVVKVRREERGWRWSQEGTIAITARHQIGNFADLCNDCGNCDVFCPERGAPQLLKPRVFGSFETWAGTPASDGFAFTRDEDADVVMGRFDGREYTLRSAAGFVRYAGPGFDVRFLETDPEGTIDGDASAEVDLTYFQIMNALGKALLSTTSVNCVNALRT